MREKLRVFRLPRAARHPDSDSYQSHHHKHEISHQQVSYRKSCKSVFVELLMFVYRFNMSIHLSVSLKLKILLPLDRTQRGVVFFQHCWSYMTVWV